MRVEISAEAERDLRQIANYIARDDVQTAIEFVSNLRAACEGLAQYPNRFPVVPRYERKGIRHRVIGNFMIFYRVGDERVTVLHVLHGAMDYSDLLRGQG